VVIAEDKRFPGISDNQLNLVIAREYALPGYVPVEMTEFPPENVKPAVK
jgi:hypothetical protein